MTGTTTGYQLSNAADGERERIAAIENAYDATTTELLSRLGVRPGAAVLLLGAGGGSVLRWAADAVGPDGRAVGTDIDPRFLAPIAEEFAHVEVWRHDVVADSLPDAEFDVVHARLLLGHLPRRDDVLGRMVAATRPGGWLLVEDFDAGSYGPAYPSPDGQKTIAAFTGLLTEAGFEPRFGRQLPTRLRRLGLEEVDAVGRVLTLRGASSPVEPFYRHTFSQLLDRVLARGLLDESDVAAFFARFDDPDYDMLTQTMMSVWGRRPGVVAARGEER